MTERSNRYLDLLYHTEVSQYLYTQGCLRSLDNQVEWSSFAPERLAEGGDCRAPIGQPGRCLVCLERARDRSNFFNNIRISIMF